jgi:hypothetical protein
MSSIEFLELSDVLEIHAVARCGRQAEEESQPGLASDLGAKSLSRFS